MVVGFFRAGADTGRDELDFRWQKLSQVRDFQRRANESAQTGFHRQRREPFDLLTDISLTADFSERVRIRTRQHRYAEHERRGQTK